MGSIAFIIGASMAVALFSLVVLTRVLWRLSRHAWHDLMAAMVDLRDAWHDLMAAMVDLRDAWHRSKR